MCPFVCIIIGLVSPLRYIIILFKPWLFCCAVVLLPFCPCGVWLLLLSICPFPWPLTLPATIEAGFFKVCLTEVCLKELKSGRICIPSRREAIKFERRPAPPCLPRNLTFGTFGLLRVCISPSGEPFGACPWSGPGAFLFTTTVWRIIWISCIGGGSDFRGAALPMKYAGIAGLPLWAARDALDIRVILGLRPCWSTGLKRPEAWKKQKYSQLSLSRLR